MQRPKQPKKSAFSFTTIVVFLLGIPACTYCEVTDDPFWPQFRGVSGDGIASANNVHEHFGEDTALKWKTPLPGRGWSSPVTARGKIWMTTAVEIFPDEKERLKILKERGVPAKQFHEHKVATSLQLSVLMVDFETGKLERTIQLQSLRSPVSIHPVNSYASPTPVIDAGKLYAHFGTMGTWCIDTATGAIIWNKALPLDHSTGPGSSPFIFEDLLVLICDGVDQQYVTALNKHTGKEIWKTKRPVMRAPLGNQKKSFCTPIAVTPKGSDQAQLICMGAQWMISYNPATGKEIWRLDHGSGFSVVPRPVFSKKHQLLYFSTGFGKPQFWAIHIDGKGDITGDVSKIAWKETKRIPARPSPLLAGDEIYVVSDGGIISCFDAASGKVLWNHRIKGDYSSSPLLADGKIFFSSHQGLITVIEPGKEFKVIAENHLDDTIMASPLAFNGTLLVRTGKAIYRFRK